MSNTQITGFDFDGVLAKPFTGEALPATIERIRPYRTQTTFIATNQAGPVFRAVLGETRYPTCDQVAQNIASVLKELSFRPDLICVAMYPNKQGGDWPIAADVAAQAMRLALPRAVGAIDCIISPRPLFRKPQPGMLTHAAQHLQVPCSHITYIGDMKTDEQAAIAAGCRYLDVNAWLAGLS